MDTSCTTGDIRLVGGPNDYEGRVELCYNHMWGPIDHFYNQNTANVVCRQLGHQPTGSLAYGGIFHFACNVYVGGMSVANSFYGTGPNPFIPLEIWCQSNGYDSLLDCNYYHYVESWHAGDASAAGVTCLGKIT